MTEKKVTTHNKSFAQKIQTRLRAVQRGVKWNERRSLGEPPIDLVPPSASRQLLETEVIKPDLWDELEGMDEIKHIIERRVILPLSKPDVASRHSVSPPKAIGLFGPPGTGKTTFAKSIASRLEWTFVEIKASELASEGMERQAHLLRRAFDHVLQLDSAVIFVDEVEDLAIAREEEDKSTPSVTNEFLKQIPRIRERPRHLLVSATNWVRKLDSAFLRPGRFDYVMPIGPPDRRGRTAVWHRYLDQITEEGIDVEQLVEATENFTVADIEFAARKAAQLAFESELFDGTRHRATTADFMKAIKETKRTLSNAMVEAFSEDIRQFARC